MSQKLAYLVKNTICIIVVAFHWAISLAKWLSRTAHGFHIQRCELDYGCRALAFDTYLASSQVLLHDFFHNEKCFFFFLQERFRKRP